MKIILINNDHDDYPGELALVTDLFLYILTGENAGDVFTYDGPDYWPTGQEIRDGLAYEYIIEKKPWL